MTCALETLESRWFDDPRWGIPAVEVADEAACSAPIDPETATFLAKNGWGRPGRGVLEVTLAPDDAWVVVDGASGWWRPPGHTFRWQLDAGLHLVQFGALGEARATGAFLADVPEGGVAAWVAGLGFAGASVAWPCEGDPADFVAQLERFGADDVAIAAARVGDAAMDCAGASQAVRQRFEAARADTWSRNGFGGGVFVTDGPWTPRRRGHLAAAHLWSIPAYLTGAAGLGLWVLDTVGEPDVPWLPLVGYAALGFAVGERQSLRQAGVVVPLTGAALGGLGVVAGLLHPTGAVVVPIGALFQVGLNEAAMARARRVRRAASSGD